MSLQFPKREPTVLLREFITLFESKGWLNRTLRLRHNSRRYRIFCSEMEFLAYRINDHSGIPPGFPGWPVCLVTEDQVIDDSTHSQFPSAEPGAHDWLRCIAEGDFEFI